MTVRVRGTGARCIDAPDLLDLAEDSWRRGPPTKQVAVMSTISSYWSSASGASNRSKVREFPNGDQYDGAWSEGVPHGNGRYTWKDSSFYDGSWQAGSRSGVGVYVWPTGARYRGEWKDGFMHGVGTLLAPNGAIYQGGWAMDLKHGLGKKVYANGDTYEGLWHNGRFQGPGRYKWANRNEYDGQWHAGRMHGQGTLIWNSGDRYDGEFKAGQEHGLGIFTWADGTTYEGHWQNGHKHGIGLYRPTYEHAERRSLALAPSTRPSEAATATADVEAVPSGPKAAQDPNPSPSTADAPLPPIAPQDQGTIESGESHRESLSGEGRERGRLGDTVFVREYEGGRMVRSEPLTPEELELVSAVPKLPNRRHRRHKRSEQRAGETIYKGHRSYDLMLNLQLGIRYSVTRVAAEQSHDTLESQHFQAKIKLNFPRDGSKATPPHPSGDFKWKDYCPLAFRQLREVFSIDAAQYMTSICGDLALREMPSPGKSGSVFFLSHDDKYIIKTVRKGEKKLLLDLLPQYCQHVERHPHTLLIKFYGLHRVRPLKGAKVRFIVMNNVFQTSLPIHQRYDLKGSTQGRGQGRGAAPNGSATILKDLDLNIQLKLEESWQNRLQWQLAQDCRLLEQLRVMDYSLLLGVTLCNTGYGSAPATDKEDDADDDRDELSALGIAPYSSGSGAQTASTPVDNLFQSSQSAALNDTPPATARSHHGLRSLESAAAVALTHALRSNLPGDSSGLSDPSEASSKSEAMPSPANIPHFESLPLRQDSVPPQPEPEPSTDLASQRRSRCVPRPGCSMLLCTHMPAQAPGNEGEDEAHSSASFVLRKSTGDLMMRMPSAPSVRQAPPRISRPSTSFVHRRSASVDDIGARGQGSGQVQGWGQERADQELRQQLEARVARGMSQKRMADLVALAQCRTLALGLRHARSATLLLAMRPQRSLANRPVASGPGSADELAHALGQTRVQLGANMAAVAQALPPRDAEGGPDSQQPLPPHEDAIVFFGIIDILQEYNMTKRLEHGLKSMRHDGTTISAVDPRQYSRRFQDFMRKVFI
ncbi:hypothetical protein WJX73_003652 [Symbiochloris irregularis]|uniref:1-phosphatidylinositol-4-phosphate 5-kinase n=1 Tax=Symbiochloris irregularis TaxID=706552 RepID=A0AAW1P0W1_9CHLO